MGEKTEAFPTFSELCTAAREIEKRPLSIPPRPIDGKLVLDESAGIFPRELEDYTYSYLLFEAQTVERRIYSNAVSASARRRDISSALTPEQQMRRELRRFVSAQEDSSLDREERELTGTLEKKREAEAKARPGQGGPAIPYETEAYEEEERALARKAFPSLPDEGRAEDAPLPGEEEMAPQPRPRPPPARGAAVIAAERLRPNSLRPPPVPAAAAVSQRTSAAPRPAQSLSPPPVPQARQAPLPLPRESPDADPQPALQGAAEAMHALRQPSEPLAQEKPGGQAGMPVSRQPAGISSYSKLSPRLQALIEAKLRREEEKARQQREDEESLIRQPPPAPEPEEEAPALQGGEEQPSHEGATPLPHGEGPEEEMEKPRALPLRKLAREEEGRATPDEEIPGPVEEMPNPAEGMPKPPGKPGPGPEEKSMPRDDWPEEGHGQEEKAPEQEEGGQMPLPEEKETARGGRDSARPAPSGAITIKPIFPDAAPAGAARPGPFAQAEDQGRMERIQRILEDLSPDKRRAAEKKEEASFAKEGEDALPQEEQAPAKAQAAPWKDALPQEEQAPAKAQAAPWKRAAKASGRKPAAPQEKAGAPARKPLASLRRAAAKKIAARAISLPSEPGNEPVPGRLPAQKRIIRKAAPSEEGPEEIGEAPVPKRQARRPVPTEEEDELPAGQPQAAPQQKAAKPIARKLAPRLPPREETGEGEEEGVPAANSARPPPAAPYPPEADGPNRAALQSPSQLKVAKKLIPRLPPREEEDAGQGEERAPIAPVGRRILPGMVRTAPSAPQTYIPPLRARRPVPVSEEEIAPGEEEPPAPRTPVRLAPRQEEEPPAPEEGQASARISPLTPRKLVSDVPAEEKSPEQLAQEEKMARMAEQLARLEAGKNHEVAGTAALPQEEEDIPLPEDPVPKPEDYAQAKEGLRRNLEHEEIARKVKQEEEATVEQFAKEHMVWLYEIYKMGGMAREDFLQKASEKYAEAKGGKPPQGAGSEEAPPNPALANLGKEIEKKDRK